MFQKILIANRGEIACRVIKTARRMGIATVAVYSEADRDARHVQLADEAVLIGPPPSAQSYLQIERIVQACRDTGAEAVHPGYGFLSENPRFSQALDAAGIVFIGPNVRAIEAMGDKITSKKLAQEAGVNTVPGHADIIPDSDVATRIAREIGYPVMLKASAGGGGKGMRVAYSDAECRDGFERATSEARSSFGDERVFIEKFIEEPRHIEIQVMADGHGNVVYLGERECSIQRRHQKVIEEAPSPFLDEATRRAMGEQACALARAVDYRSAGTVEFIVDKDRQFYFLEMNTRLQVEHPVTEYITGVDLVELMLRVAAGEQLPLTQDQIRLDGWALESRIYAEDPVRGFLPSIGRLARYQPPDEDGHVRVDTGVGEGGEVSMYYDPMIAKLITWDADRDRAIERMRTALDAFYIEGVAHNIPFLAALMAHPRFVEGRLSTNFIAEEYPDGYQAPAPTPEQARRLVLAAAAIHRRRADRASATTGQLPGHEYQVADDSVVVLDGVQYPLRIQPVESGYQIEFDGRASTVETQWRFGQPLLQVVIDGEPCCIQVTRGTIDYRLFHAGVQARALVLTPRAAEFEALMPEKAPPDLSKYLLSPMPGLLVKVLVGPGEDVQAGQDLAVVEAMKMENVLRAVVDGTVAAVLVEPGASLAVDQPIIEFE
ncbi:MAG: acetyl/propionyl/methylcrotonyl-CoA carboxylase subunit alpha [Candidatus Competibacterales bacterium]|nr:acetyl/propionyl/methylcrotonyl-CoA carboxylase subunit alpha [Candidatus Competibacterales bacterium]